MNNLDQVMDQLDPSLKVPKPPTEAQFRLARKIYWTQQYKTVDACGHKFHPTDAPKTNCDDCWIAYFQVHGEVTQLCDEIFRKEGLATLKKLKGDKYAKNFVRFMAGLAQYQKEHSVESVGDASNSSTSTEGTGAGSTDTGNIGTEVESTSGDWKAAKEGL